MVTVTISVSTLPESPEWSQFVELSDANLQRLKTIESCLLIYRLFNRTRGDAHNFCRTSKKFYVVKNFGSFLLEQYSKNPGTKMRLKSSGIDWQNFQIDWLRVKNLEGP